MHIFGQTSLLNSVSAYNSHRPLVPDFLLSYVKQSPLHTYILLSLEHV